MASIVGDQRLQARARKALEGFCICAGVEQRKKAELVVRVHRAPAAKAASKCEGDKRFLHGRRKRERVRMERADAARQRGLPFSWAEVSKRCGGCLARPG